MQSPKAMIEHLFSDRNANRAGRGGSSDSYIRQAMKYISSAIAVGLLIASCAPGTATKPVQTPTPIVYEMKTPTPAYTPVPATATFVPATAIPAPPTPTIVVPTATPESRFGEFRLTLPFPKDVEYKWQDVKAGQWPYRIDVILPEGTPILAAEDGVFMVIGYGMTANGITIGHPSGYVTEYNVDNQAEIVIKQTPTGVQDISRRQLLAYAGKPIRTSKIGANLILMLYTTENNDFKKRERTDLHTTDFQQ